MARFDIISKDGKTIRYSGKPRYCGSYLKPSFLEFSEMAYPTPIAWEVGDYVDYPRTGMRYRLYSIPQPSKNARKGSYGGAFTYSNVQFHAATKELEIALFRDLVANDNNIHFSTSPDVATYENVEGIARRIQACMDDFYPGRWEIRIAEFDAVADAEVIEKIATAKDFALSGGTCLDALSKIYELWEEIGWVHTHENGKEVITIGYANKRIGANTTDVYLYGKGNGLTAIKKSQTNKDEFSTRLYVYGSERNLPHRYYNGKDILNAESVDIRNLMLPLDKWGLTDGLPDAHKAYLENAEAVAKYGVIPKIHYFDSDDAGADIYPSIEGMTVGQLRKVLADMDDTKYSPSASIYPNDSERVDEIWGAPRVMDDGVLKKDGKEHDMDYGWYLFAETTPETTIPKGTAEKIAVVENYIIKDLEVDAQGIIRAKITFTSEKICTIADAGYESVSGVLTLANSLDSPSIEEEMGFTFVLNEDGVWEGRLPKVIANYDQLSYIKYVAFATMSVYVTPKKALASDVTASVNISDGYVTFIADQLFDKTFQLALKQIGFDINERAAIGEGKVISMKTGMCAGRNFVISECRYVANVDRWVLICRRQQDDTLGMLFPNKDYQIATDDQFVLLNIALPEVYIRANQERLLTEGEKLLAKASKIQSHYEPMIDAKVMIESGRTLREGMYMEISDEDVIDNGTDYILIDTLSIYEDESAIPTYKVTLREKRKVTYKGTPSATSETSTKSYGEDQTVNADIDLSDYATKDYVDNAIGNITPGGGDNSVDIEGSEFVKVSSSGKISLEIDSQGGLGNTGQGLGIVEIPSNLLEGNVYNVYYTENNELSEEQLEANKKAYAALASEEKAAFYLVQEGNVYSRLIVSTTMKSASTEAIAVEAHVILPIGNKTILGTTAINLYSDGHISMTVVQNNLPTEDEVNAALEQKQDVLVSGTTIKTINGESILGEGDIEIQGGNGGGAEVRTLFVNDAGLSADELSYNAETVQLIFAQHPMIFFASTEEGTPLSEYELMGMDNGRMVFARYELNEYSTGATYIYLAMDGSTEVGGFSKSELDGDKYDSSLDADSVNAVQNKVVTENIKALEATLPLMAVIDLDTIIAQDTPIDNATRNALLELGGYTSGDKYFSKGWVWSRGYLYTIKVIPTDAGVQIHVLSLKGWTEIAEDNTKVNHLPSQGNVSIEVDSELSETSENAVSNKAVTMALAETEEVTAAALNELNERFEEYATKEDIDATLAEMDEEINHIEGVLEATIIEDEEVTAAALNDLDKRVTNLEQNGGGGGGGDIYNVSFTIDPSTMELVMAYDVQPTFDFTLDENGNLIAII